MKRFLLAFCASLISGSALAQTSTLTPAPNVSPSDQTSIIKPVTPDVTNPTGFVDRRATMAQILAAGGRVVNMVDYGADPGGVADSCGAPLTNALAAITAINPSSAIGGVLYWPRGLYLCGTQISWVNKPIAIVGDGSGLTSLVFTSAATGQAGIKITQTNPNSQVLIQGLRVVAATANEPNNNAIEVDYSAHVSFEPTATFVDLIINGNDTSTYYWKNGIWCSGCSWSVFDRVFITGRVETFTAGVTSSNMNAGIHLNGQGMSPGEASTDVVILNSRVLFANYGVYISGDSEGAHIIGSTFLATNYGLYLDDYAGSSDPTSLPNSPGSYMTLNHCNSFFACFTSKGFNNSIIANNQFYKRNDMGFTGNWNALEFLDGSYTGGTAPTSSTTAMGNSSVGFRASGSYSSGGISKHVVLGQNAVGNIVQNDITGLDDYFADVGSGTGVNIITDNKQMTVFPLGNQWFTGTNPNIITKGNQPELTPNDIGISVLASGSASPLIAVSPNDMYAFLNASPQNVTSFSGGYYGRIIYVTSNNTNTTLVHSATLILAGNVPWTMPAGGVITLRRETTYWRELSRSP